MMSRRSHLSQLRESAPVVLPSLLLCDFSNLEREVMELEEAGVSALHLDVMDGHFVPNLTYGMPIVEAFRKLTEMPLDVHLMISNPEQYIRQFYDAGADIITFHVEATEDPAAVLREIHSLDMGAGIALNPDTPVSTIEPHLQLCDLVVVMSVNAGFGGQSFQPIALEKLRHLRKIAPAETLLEVDGGINQNTIGDCSEAGARLFVVGSGVFKAENYSNAVRQLTESARERLGA